MSSDVLSSPLARLVHWESVSDLIPFAIYLVDIETMRLINVNRVMRERTGAAVGQICHEAIYQTDAPCIFCPIRDMLLQPQPIGTTTTFEHFNDVDDRWYQLQETLIVWFDGRTAKYSISVDISALKEVQNALAEAHAELALKNRDLAGRTLELEESLLRLREAQRQLVIQENMACLGRLVAGVAHEINSPLGAAVTSATHLANITAGMRTIFSAGTVRRRDMEAYLDVAEETIQLLVRNLGRVDNLVQSFKGVAAEQAPDDRQNFDLSECLSDLTTGLAARNDSRYNRLSIECPKGIVFDSYPTSIVRVLTELIENSLKHAFGDSLEKAVELAIKVAPSANGFVEILYSDNGCGIQTDHLPRLFDPFFTTARGKGAVGLGLHVVFNTVAQVLGGRISVESVLGSGTTFTLSLPKKAPIGENPASI